MSNEITMLTEKVDRLRDEARGHRYGTPKHNDYLNARTALDAARMAQIGGPDDGILVYNSNNSGGGWWVSDQGWKALEDAGWCVHWVQQQGFNEYSLGGVSTYSCYQDDPRDLVRIEDRDGLAAIRTYDQAVGLGSTYLGALATSAAVITSDPNASVIHWEQATGCNAGDEGCNCCGEPHSFTFHAPDGSESSPGIEVVSTFRGF